MKALELEPISSPTEPPNAGSALANSEVFLNYQSAYENLTGMSLWLKCKPQGSAQPETKETANQFCYLLSAHEERCRECLSHSMEEGVNPNEKVQTRKCFAGISSTQVNVFNSEGAIGCLSTGFVSLDEQAPPKFDAVANYLKNRDTDANLSSLEEAWQQTLRMKKQHYESSIQLVSNFADHLSMISEDMLPGLTLAAQSGRNPALERALEYIKSHLQEPLTLDEVADAINISRCYFSRLFKEKFGVSFTTYVSSLRIKQTKQLLMRSDLSITEIAFKVGFQSMSQFNRTFKDFEKQTPSAFRRLNRETLNV